MNRPSRALAVALLVVLYACKKEDKAAEPDKEPTAKTEREEPTPADAAAAAQPDQELVQSLGEDPHVVYSSDDGVTTPIIWEVGGAKILVTVLADAVEQDGEPSVRAVVVGRTDPDAEDQEIFSCENLDPASGGYVDLMVRDDKIHIRCINPAHSGDPGETEAARFAFDGGASKFVQSGGYSGEGVVDPDTIDLDEE